MNRELYKEARRCARGVRRLMQEANDDTTLMRSALGGLSLDFSRFSALGINVFDTLQCQGAEWVVGMIPRRVANFEGDNFKRALLDRRLCRTLRIGAYQPGPRPGSLP